MRGFSLDGCFLPGTAAGPFIRTHVPDEMYCRDRPAHALLKALVETRASAARSPDPAQVHAPVPRAGLGIAMEINRQHEHASGSKCLRCAAGDELQCAGKHADDFLR